MSENKEDHQWMRDVERVARIGRWEVDLRTNKSHLTQGVLDIFEIDRHEIPPLEEQLNFYSEEFHFRIKQVFKNLIEFGEEGEYEAQIQTKNGALKWVHVVGRAIKEKEKVVKIFGTVQDRTKSKKNELHLNLMLDSTEESFVLIGKDFKIITFNKSFKTTYESYFAKKVVTGESILEFASPKRRTQVRGIYEKVFEGKTEKSVLEIPSLDGNGNKTFNIFFKPAYDDHRKIVGAFVTVVDVTEQSNANKKLLERESRFRSLVENGSDAVAVIELDGSIEYVTPSVINILGYSVEELNKMDMFELIHPEDKGPSFKVLEKALENPGIPIQGHTSKMLHKDGSWRWIEAVVTNMLEDPSVKGLVDNFRDVTVQYEAELELARVHKQLRTHLENSPLGVVEYDKNLKITKWSKKCEEIFGWTEEEILKKDTHAFDLVFQEDQKKVNKVADELTSAEIDGNISTNRNYTKEGKIIDCRWYNSVITDEKGEVATIMSLVQDITRQLTIEKEREKSIQEKTTLLAEIHHRVKNNLAIVSGLLQLQVLETEEQQIIESLQDSVSRIKSIALVHEQLYNSDDFQNIRFDKNIQKLVTGISEIMNQNGKILIDFEMSSVHLTINQAVPSALFVNEAVTNVFKHAFEEDVSGVLKIVTQSKGDKIKIIISDDGQGFDKSKYLTENSSLGLKLLEMVSAQLDGTLAIDTDLNGTVVHLEFEKSKTMKGSYGSSINY